MGWWHHGWGIGGWESILIGGVMMLLFWGGLFALVFFGIRAATGTGRRQEAEPTDQALSILAERFAKGEITSEEYQEMRRVLQE